MNMYHQNRELNDKSEKQLNIMTKKKILNYNFKKKTHLKRSLNPNFIIHETKHFNGLLYYASGIGRGLPNLKELQKIMYSFMCELYNC
jgi:hypothetical protein